MRDRSLGYERAQRTLKSPNVRSTRFCLEHKPGLGRSKPQIAPPAPDAGRGVAKRRRDRRAEVRRLQPSQAHPEKSPFTAIKRTEPPSKPRLKPIALQTIIGGPPCFGVDVSLLSGTCRSLHRTRGGFPLAPGRAAGGRGRTRPTEPQAERSRAQRSGPDLPRPFRAPPAVEGTGSRRTQQRGVRRDLVPGAGPSWFTGDDCLA